MNRMRTLRDARQKHSGMTEEVRKEPDPRVIEGLANLVERGVVVTGNLNDGSFVALMVELRRRGNEPIARSEAARQLKPFMVVVARSQ
jgi:hypothetical protein